MIISVIAVICAVTLWNTIYYGLYDYHYNFLLDTSYTIFIAIVLWWLSSFYDKSRTLLKNLYESEERYKSASYSRSGPIKILFYETLI